MQNIIYRSSIDGFFNVDVTQLAEAHLSGIIHRIESRHAIVAQQVEQLICNQFVGGSNPSDGSKPCRDNQFVGGALNNPMERPSNTSDS